MHRTVFIVLLYTALAAADGNAQDQREVVHVLDATAEHFASALGDTVVTVDPRIATRAHRSRSGTFEGPWSQAALAGFRGKLADRIAEQSQVFVCTSRSPRDCRIEGADAFIKFGMPLIEDRTAIIFVDVMHRTSSTRTPVATRQHKIVLHLVGGVWRVAEDVIVAQS